MKRIERFELENQHLNVLQVGDDYYILHAEAVFGRLFLWVMHDNEKPRTECHIRLYDDGPCDEKPYDHLVTVVVMGRPLHLFTSRIKAPTNAQQSLSV